MTHQIQKLLPRHFQILDLLVAGHKNTEVAEIVGCTRETVYAVTRSPLFINEFNRRMRTRNVDGPAQQAEAFESRARSILNQSAERAAEIQVGLLESNDDSVKLRASGSILDRALGKVDSGVTGSNVTNITINSERADLLLLALKESANGVDERHSADSKTAHPPEDQQGDVHQASVERPRLGHRSPEAQDLREMMVPVRPKLVKNLNGSQETPQPKGT